MFVWGRGRPSGEIGYVRLLPPSVKRRRAHGMESPGLVAFRMALSATLVLPMCSRLTISPVKGPGVQGTVNAGV